MPIRTVKQFIDCIPGVSASSKALLEARVQKLGVSLSSTCNETCKDALLSADLSTAESKAVRQALTCFYFVVPQAGPTTQQDVATMAKLAHEISYVDAWREKTKASWFCCWWMPGIFLGDLTHAHFPASIGRLNALVWGMAGACIAFAFLGAAVSPECYVGIVMCFAVFWVLIADYRRDHVLEDAQVLEKHYRFLQHTVVLLSSFVAQAPHTLPNHASVLQQEARVILERTQALLIAREAPMQRKPVL